MAAAAALNDRHLGIAPASVNRAAIARALPLHLLRGRLRGDGAENPAVDALDLPPWWNDWTPVSLSLLLQHLSIVTLKGRGDFFMEWKPAINSLEGFFFFFVTILFFLMQFCFGGVFQSELCTQSLVSRSSLGNPVAMLQLASSVSSRSRVAHRSPALLRHTLLLLHLV